MRFIYIIISQNNFISIQRQFALQQHPSQNKTKPKMEQIIDRYLSAPLPKYIQQVITNIDNNKHVKNSGNIQEVAECPYCRNGQVDKKRESLKKTSIMSVFNHQEEYVSTKIIKDQGEGQQKRVCAYQKILGEEVVDLEALRKEAWKGVPQNKRSIVWRLLLKYSPTNRDNREQALNKKREDYFTMVDTYIEKPTLQRDAQQKKVLKLINDDVLRTLPETTLFRNQRIQKMLRRILYIWHMRHPSSGYVQGINDIVTPFIIVFLNEHIPINFETVEVPQKLSEVPDEKLNQVQGDSYWCVCKTLDCILDNYTSSWPGIQKSFAQTKQVIKRVDPGLLMHFQKQGIDFYHMYFKWITCLLLRQFTVKIGLRLFDTYLSDEKNYFSFCLYILAAIILKYSKKFKKSKFQEMMIFQQNMPTKKWTEQDLATVISEAYVYQNCFSK